MRAGAGAGAGAGSRFRGGGVDGGGGEVGGEIEDDYTGALHGQGSRLQ